MTDTDEGPMFSPAGELVVQIMEAQRRGLEHTMNTLYNVERRQRLAYEVHHSRFMRDLTAVQGGSVREYEEVINRYEFQPMGFTEEDRLARQHPDWREDL